MTVTPNSLHAAALAYAQRGWHVFPVEPPTIGNDESGKRPLTRNGKDDATTDVAVINEWWTRWPNANVAVACAPSGLCVLDVDVGVKKDGKRKKGRESLAKIIADHGELPDTLTAITGSGGLHAFYETDGGPALQRLGLVEKDSGLDLIGNGYVIVAPSMHYTGRPYAWNVVRNPVRLPSVLRTIAALRPTVEKVESTRDPIGQGGRNVGLFRLGCYLRESGIGLEALARALDAENKERCQPPVDDAELKLIVDSVWNRVTPSRDVAAGAVVEQEVQQIFAPEARAVWVKDVGAKLSPPTRFFSTGFPGLDTLIGGGFATRHQCGILGPPSSGKSAFVDCVVDSLQRQIPMLHVSTELPREELFIRYACGKMGIPWRDGMQGRVPREDMVAAVQNLRIKLIGCEDLDRNDPLGSIIQAAQEMAQQMGIPPGIAIDYVQLLARGAADQMRHKVGELSMRIRVLAQALDTPVLAVYSTRRDFYGSNKMDQLRKGTDPTAYLAAAKESGDVEFDCATMLYLDVDKLATGQPKAARIVVPRCRVGDVGFVGARAKLDTGVWWEDASALSELGVGERESRYNQIREDRDLERLVETIRKMPGRPWRDIRAGCGIGPDRASAAKAKAITEGLIEIVTEVGYDKLARRQVKETLKIRENDKPPPEP